MRPGYGFSSKSDLDKAVKLLISDNGAFDEFISKLLFTGRAIKFNGGEEVHVEGAGLTGACVRIRGSSRSYWTVIEQLR